jgi:phage terminase small subunit
MRDFLFLTLFRAHIISKKHARKRYEQSNQTKKAYPLPSYLDTGNSASARRNTSRLLRRSVRLG